ncbi:MAG: bifunctional pyr operon transcriptional regulator/uracil phosphoribosyltransferase [Rhodothermaceae bacterium]|nr:phosphoribosyltransferase family protein [Bacteroidota bacterium]MXW14422.1 bifunctional pyr operon transcriptional regulator/uracil phosphoribosyltransferase [Rhodothermaceae bacterium]MXW33771.1 bifunctional pyr operon transcriptional regulator/uracil phosphoribosyltransferase [Rhodothermaceae bacterium]MXX96130.1 bifunctional pyr operon transcriptional regulator/uracil phosphoribosyltransferase [Rhodothermaceae bacterium]MXZ17877.1 bifunctional pyr operon transcriptional regulator/uracil 
MHTLILGKERIERTLARLACEVDERNQGTEGLVLFGVVPKGILVAQALARHISEIAGRSVVPVPLDLEDPSQKPEDVTGKVVVIVDDVLYTGRTAHRAVAAVCEMGSPARIQLMVLIDRGHREMPLQPDYVGRKLQTKYRERVDVDAEEGLSVYLTE